MNQVVSNNNRGMIASVFPRSNWSFSEILQVYSWSYSSHFQMSNSRATAAPRKGRRQDWFMDVSFSSGHNTSEETVKYRLDILRPKSYSWENTDLCLKCMSAVYFLQIERWLSHLLKTYDLRKSVAHVSGWHLHKTCRNTLTLHVCELTLFSVMLWPSGTPYFLVLEGRFSKNAACAFFEFAIR